MYLISPTDILCLKALLTTTILYSGAQVVRNFIQPSTEPLFPASSTTRNVENRQKRLPPTRSIRKALEQSQSKCIVLYGTETGTAGRLAANFAKAAKAEYGMDCVVGDLGDYDYDDLASLGSTYALVLFLATAGDGEMASNSNRLRQYVSDRSAERRFETLQYAAFGLGSSSYRLFNAAVKAVDGALCGAGAYRLGETGLGDDGRGTLDDDFLQWKDNNLPCLGKALACVQQPYIFSPAFHVEEVEGTDSSLLFNGEPNKAQLYGKVKGPFTAGNAYPACISGFRELTSEQSERRCFHIEFDTSGSTVTYSTGDHLAIRPANPPVEVERFLRVFGLEDKAETVIDVTSKDPTFACFLPGLATYRAVVTHYLNICGPVSRQALSILAGLQADSQARKTLRSLADNVDVFTKTVKEKQLNLAQVLQSYTPPAVWASTGFAVLLECLGPLKARHYSISSSHVVVRKAISVTVVEEGRHQQGWDFPFKGVCTSYLSEQLSKAQAGTGQRAQPERKEVASRDSTVYISVRRSQFRLPRNCEVPILMIGPGTGVAPFRAFVQERAHESAQGKQVGKTMLFYGCRNPDEDFLYREEWKDFEKVLPPNGFEMHVALSRTPGNKKQYVQDKLHDQAASIRRLVLRENAHVYICGNAARMAKDVAAAMRGILAEDGETVAGVEEYLVEMKRTKRWCEDVW